MKVAMYVRVGRVTMIEMPQPENNSSGTTNEPSDENNNTSGEEPEENVYPSGGTEPEKPVEIVDFEAYMDQQGFPESYKTLLRNLHEKYPNWVFEAYHTGLDWNTVIDEESIAGKNLIPNSKSMAIRSKGMALLPFSYCA